MWNGDSRLLAYSIAHLVDAAGKRASSQGCLRHDLLKRAKAVVERALATAAHEGEARLERPLASVVGILERRDYRSKRLSLKLAGSGGIVYIVGEQSVIVLDGAVLIRQLPVDGQVVALAQESHTGGIVIHTVYANRSLTAHHAVESDVLIGVCKQASGHYGICH